MSYFVKYNITFSGLFKNAKANIINLFSVGATWLTIVLDNCSCSDLFQLLLPYEENFVPSCLKLFLDWRCWSVSVNITWFCSLSSQTL